MGADKRKARQADKAARKQKRAASKQRWVQLWQAFNMQRKQDNKLVPLVVLAIVGMTIVGIVVGHFYGGFFMGVIGFLLGFMLALWIFTRRLQATVYKRAEGQPGAAGWALENLKSGVGIVWKAKPAVAANGHMDIVHRVVGNCGIVLVGEGEPHRVKPLLSQQRKRLARISPSTPIFELQVGTHEGQIPIKRLQKELLKLPRVMKKDETYELAARIDSVDASLSSGRQGLPKGPLPAKASMAGMNRRARRTKARGGR